MNRCKHNEISAKYNIGEFLLDEQRISIRTMTWVCKECGEYGVGAEKISAKESEHGVVSSNGWYIGK